MDWLKNTQRYFFSNGLTLLLHPLQNSEAAALHFCVKAGYFCETDAEIGLAHLLEHMYFKGSANFPVPGTLGIRMKSLGGMINATTSYDQTNYFCEVPSQNLIPALDIMADSFAFPLFPAEELVKECEVVIEEFNRKLDNPSAYSQELLIQLAYTTHRMKRWRIGTPGQLRSYTPDHLFDYFYRYYQPQNMVVTVAGKFDPIEVREKVEQLLAPMKNRELKKDFGPNEPPQTGLRYAKKHAVATQSYLHFGFHAPGVLHPDGPAVETLAFLLSGGRSGRLHRHVVERRRSAMAASCYYLAYENIGLLMVTGVTEAGKIRTAATDIWSVLDDLRENGVAADELKKIKNKLRLHHAMQTEDALSLAEVLSYYEAYGSYLRLEEYLNRMNEITEKEILDAVEKYVRIDNLSIMEYVNEELPDLSTQSFRENLVSGSVPPETNLTPPLLIQTNNGSVSFKTAELPVVRLGHATYIFHPDQHYPFIAAGIFFRGGRNEESDSTAGITHLMHRCGLKGTSLYTSEQLASHFDELGNPPRFSCYRDFSGFTMEALPEFFPAMFDLLIHCVTDAQFPAVEVETEKGKVHSAIRRNLDDSYVRPVQLFQRAFYGSHPYSLPETGFEESISAMDRELLAVWKKRLWSARRSIIAVVGSFDPDEMYDHLERNLSMMVEFAEDPEIPTAVKTPVHHSEIEDRPKKQTAFVLGFPCPPASSSEIPRFDVLQQILSGMGGRLFLNLRSKKALAYTVHASTITSLHAGAFVTYIASEASKEKEALDGMWGELQKLKDEPVSESELENAKHALMGSYTLNTQTASSRVLDYIHCHLLGRSLPYAPVYRELLQRITGSELLEIARRTFHQDNSTIAIVRGMQGTPETEQMIVAS